MNCRYQTTLEYSSRHAADCYAKSKLPSVSDRAVFPGFQLDVTKLPCETLSPNSAKRSVLGLSGYAESCENRRQAPAGRTSGREKGTDTGRRQEAENGELVEKRVKTWGLG